MRRRRVFGLAPLARSHVRSVAKFVLGSFCTEEIFQVFSVVCASLDDPQRVADA
jgi:hypothetical protein